MTACLFRLFGAALAVAAPTLAAAQSVTASSPEKLAEIVRAEGYRATVGKDSVGDPMITVGVEGMDTTILFFGCTAGKECQSVVFRAGFDLPNGLAPERVNAWNRENLVGGAWLDDENDPFLDYFVTLTGGVSRENFADALDWWAVAVRGFKEHIDF
jgi:hypothetical protein